MGDFRLGMAQQRGGLPRPGVRCGTPQEFFNIREMIKHPAPSIHRPEPTRSFGQFKQGFHMPLQHAIHIVGTGAQQRCKGRFRQRGFPERFRHRPHRGNIPVRKNTFIIFIHDGGETERQPKTPHAFRVHIGKLRGLAQGIAR